MTKPFRIRFFGSQSHNLKSKTWTEFFDSAQDEVRRSFQNPKWVVIFTIAFTFVVGGAVAQAQQAGKIPRIGYLDQALLPVARFLWRRSGRSCASLDGLREKISPSSTGLQRTKVERLPELAAELVRLKVDLIVVEGRGVALAARAQLLPSQL